MAAEGLDRAWRAAATGFCFAVFGIGELVLAFAVFPAMMLFVRDEAERGRRAKAVLHHAFRGFVELMRRCGVLEYEVRHLDRLDRPGLLVLANHPTLIDAVFLIAFMARADCIIKGAVLGNPFTRYAVLAGGYILNTDGPGLVAACGRTLADGNSLIVFPEGTRSPRQGLRKFQRGAAHVALRGRRDITPVVFRVSEHNLSRDSRWWKTPRRRVRFDIEVGEDIAVAPYLERKKEAPAAARELTRRLRHYFTEKLGDPRGS